MASLGHPQLKVNSSTRVKEQLHSEQHAGSLSEVSKRTTLTVCVCPSFWACRQNNANDIDGVWTLLKVAQVSESIPLTNE